MKISIILRTLFGWLLIIGYLYRQSFNEMIVKFIFNSKNWPAILNQFWMEMGINYNVFTRSCQYFTINYVLWRAKVFVEYIHALWGLKFGMKDDGSSLFRILKLVFMTILERLIDLNAGNSSKHGTLILWFLINGLKPDRPVIIWCFTHWGNLGNGEYLSV
jgi:hypothetical protein